MCSCINIEIGSYDNQILVIDSPKWSIKSLSIDTCIIDEILFLWKMGVKTTGCCCGHNKAGSYITIRGEYHLTMIDELEYDSWTNEFGGNLL